MQRFFYCLLLLLFLFSCNSKYIILNDDISYRQNEEITNTDPDNATYVQNLFKVGRTIDTAYLRLRTSEKSTIANLPWVSSSQNVSCIFFTSKDISGTYRMYPRMIVSDGDNVSIVHFYVERPINGGWYACGEISAKEVLVDGKVEIHTIITIQHFNYGNYHLEQITYNLSTDTTEYKDLGEVDLDELNEHKEQDTGLFIRP